MSTVDLHLHRRPDPDVRPGLGVRPGESDPAAMLCRVLLLLAALMVMAALGLAWWLL